MKLILTAVLAKVFIIILHCDESLQSKILINTQPSKKSPQKGLKILNVNKFKKYNISNIIKSKSLKKYVDENNYTVFPAIIDKDLVITDKLFYLNKEERKSRVKKVLPAYQIPAIRRKRSVTNTTLPKKEAKKNLKQNNKHKGDTTKKKKRTKSIKTSPDPPQAKLRKKKNNVRETTPNENALKNKKSKNNNNEKYQRIHKKTKMTKPKNEVARKNILRATKKINSHKKNKMRSAKKVRNRRLIAARDAMIQDYPYVVSIQKAGEHWCAGALLNQRLVITTANCIWKANRLSRLKVRSCSRFSDYGGQVAKIMEVMKHPRWSIRSTPDNDIGLILLDRAIKFSDKCHGADLPNRAMLPAFEDAWVTSWGAERRDGVFEQTAHPLQVYHAQLLSRDKCNNVTQRFGVSVTENFLCLAQTGRRAPCTRDTGAPAVSDGIVWGLASWGIRKLCGTERFPAMFSYLASPSNIDFITNATHILMSDKRFYPYGDRFPLRVIETTTDKIS